MNFKTTLMLKEILAKTLSQKVTTINTFLSEVCFKRKYVITDKLRSLPRLLHYYMLYADVKI